MRGEEIENLGDESKQLSALLYVLFMKRGGGIDSPRPKPDDFLKLQANLTADTKQLLAQQPDEFAKHNLLHSWVVNVIWKKTFPEMDDKKLEDFSQTLSPPRREAFERMSPPDRDRELRQTYAMSSLLGFRPTGMNEPPDDPSNRFGPGGPRNGPDDRGEPRPPRFGDMFKRMLDGPPPNDRPPTDGRVPEDRPPPK